MTLKGNDDCSRVDGILLPILTLAFAVLVGVGAAIGTVIVIADLFPTNKDMIPVAFVCAAVIGSALGLGLRRKILSSLRTRARCIENED
jgi:hypothetical protein